jgi:hypothetical protein
MYRSKLLDFSVVFSEIIAEMIDFLFAESLYAGPVRTIRPQTLHGMRCLPAAPFFSKAPCLKILAIFWPLFSYFSGALQ